MPSKKLKHYSDEQAGISRKKWGRGFSYFDRKGERIEDKKVVDRIKALVIPPKWKDVWICPHPDGHLQATGMDEKGRKQYLYHEKYVELRKKEKFAKLMPFGKKLPDIRKQVRQHLKEKEWTRTKMLALIVMIMDESPIRIGNACYKEANETYGLTTMRRKHLEMTANGISFSFKAKSGKNREVEIENKQVRKLIRECSRLPGYEIFSYTEKGKKKRTVDSSEVNEYIQNISGEDFSSKVFRTWAGTALSVYLYELALEEVEQNPRRELVAVLVEKVAKALGNTVATCREYYIHPKILAQAEKRSVPIPSEFEAKKSKYYDPELEDYEIIVLEILQSDDK